MDYTKLSKVICRVTCGDSCGSAFLVNCNFALTAFHVLDDLNNILLHFDGVNEPYKAQYASEFDQYETIDIAVLRINEKIECDCFFDFANRKINPGEKWESRAYPAVKGTTGNNFFGNDHVVQQQLSDLKNNKYDVELEHDKKLSSYKGVSGSPLIIDEKICGIINSELLEKNESKELCAISCKYFIDLLMYLNAIISKEYIPDMDKSDIAGIHLWKKTTPSDKRNLSGKIYDVCSAISERRVKKYNRDVASGKIESELFSDRVISALKFRIFEVCQDELIRFVDTRVDSALSPDEIDNLIDVFTTKAELIVKDRSTDYSYNGISNRDLLRKIVLDLIDECYLAFDEYGIYEE